MTSLDEVTCTNPQCVQMELQQGGGGFPGREPSSPGNWLCCGQHHRRGTPSGGSPRWLPGAFIFSYPVRSG